MHQRVAKTFRIGRAILAGDTAHVNSPIGAMGMNSGVHDAFNLADKLARILRAKPRRPARPLRASAPARCVKHTQAQTIRNKRLLAEKDPAVRKRNHDELRRTGRPEARAAVLLRTSLIESLREAERIPLSDKGPTQHMMRMYGSRPSVRARGQRRLVVP